MEAENATKVGLRRLQRGLAAAWAGAWILGIGILSWVAVRLSDRVHWQDFDGQLALYATAVYGLAWFDERGNFHDEALRLEGDLSEGTADIWVVEPGVLDAHLGPEEALFELESLDEIAEAVVSSTADVLSDGVDARGAPYRLYAIPTYEEGVTDVAKAAIVVVGDPQPTINAHQAFVGKLAFAALGVGVAGVAVGLIMARYSLRPLAAALGQRERFLVAAAHELRTPVASLRAVSESATAGDEPAETALERVKALTLRTEEVVDELLLFARLDAGAAQVERQSVRLDLLVEACLPEGAQVRVDAEETVADVDPRLVRVAVKNLLENALGHSGAREVEVQASVSGSTVMVEDNGTGFSDAVLEIARGPFSAAPSNRGAGIGLATVRMIAELHGGRLVLENRAEGGARATLHLG